MPLLNVAQGYVLLLFFAVAMIALTWAVSRNPAWRHTGTGFLVAGRNVPWWVAAPSIAASWVWAPALFVSVQKSYELGLPGIFWFTVPNIFALVIFAWLAPRIRKVIPGGYTLPDWILFRFNNRKLHFLYLIPLVWYQVMAVCVQIFVGGLMLNYLTGISLNILMPVLLLICLSYSLVSGLRASIVTDFVQMALILCGIAIIIPWVLATTGFEALHKGLGGLAGKTDIFDPTVAFSFGIVTSIGLIAGALSDQQYWQRSFAIREGDLKKSFIAGGLLFGIVPVALSVLGFLAANPDLAIAAPQGTGLPMIGISTVATLLPKAAVLFFVVMLIAGLCSTLDSGLCAASSLYAIDMVRLSAAERAILDKGRLNESLTHAEAAIKTELDSKTMMRSRVAMVGLSVIGLAAAYIVQHLFSLDRLWWIFNGVSACFVVPTVLSILWDRLTARGAIFGILASLAGMVAFVYGNWIQNDKITVFSALFIVLSSVFFCFVFRRKKP